MKRIRSAALMVALVVATATGTLAQQAFTKGMVKKIKPEGGLVTISHEALTNLDMPAMTTSFRVADPSMLRRLQPGKPVTFAADRINGKLTITALK
ncbi:periplasmic copper-binding protein [Roseovarius litorisediminis]|uniref:Periplasmic copper-binding protein n=1 Tax=Roseovarius litorisediminis TaxID=1312363 RepID=A0A1Y5T1Z4_9RHOB|nr:copper-binding protein [Roseovarius litorisediminis]SLN54165.1 periplasmic copper-binding protein [Roseovarius litorisediminis]